MTKKQGKKSDYLFKGNLKRNEDKIWNFFFRTEKQCFRKKWYSFHHMVETDGVSCSILLLRKDKVGKRVKQPKNKNKELYIDEVKTNLKNKKIVAIDPNMSDLLYCVDGDYENILVCTEIHLCMNEPYYSCFNLPFFQISTTIMMEMTSLSISNSPLC